MDDVLIYIFTNLFRDSLDQYKKSNATSLIYPKILLETATANKTLVKAVVNSGRLDILTQVTREFESTLTKENNIQVAASDLQYLTPMLNQIALVVLQVWVANGCLENSDQLYLRMKHELGIIVENI